MRLTSLVRLLSSVRPLAWSLLAVAVSCLLIAQWLGSVLMLGLGACVGFLVVMAMLAVLLPTKAGVRIQMRPTRAEVGSTAACHIEVDNVGLLTMQQPSVEFEAVGQMQSKALPAVRRRGRASTTFMVPAKRRGVHSVGPARVYQQDSFGLFRRRCGSSECVDFYVRPRIVDVENLGVGQASDLEGVVTDEISMSDLSFHALREYVPGDDLRHVHWRSSAKASRLLVRQYHDTRRSQLTVVVDAARDAYRTSVEFELAMSMAASLASRAATDDLELSFHCGEEHLVNALPDGALDAICRAERGNDDVGAVLARARAETSGGVGLVAVITGGLSGDEPARHAVAAFAGPGRILLLRADVQAQQRLRPVGAAMVGDVANLEQFPAVMQQFLWGDP